MGAGGTVAVGTGAAAFQHLIKNQRPWYMQSRLVLLNVWIFVLLITSSTNGFDGSMMNGLQILPQWNLAFNNPTEGTLGLLAAIQNIGGLCALPFAPYMADGIGRKPTIFFGAVLMIIATVLQTASQSVSMFIGARWLIGFGLTFANLAAPLLVTEIAYPTQRAQLTSVYNTLWYLGSIIAAWSTFGTFKLASSWAWRIPSALQGLPSVIQVMFIFLIPESPRWLVNKGREEQALKTLAYYHANGDENDPLVQFELEEIKAAIKIDKEVSSNVGWSSLFTQRGNLRRLRIIVALAFFSQWSGNGLVSYFLGQVMNLLGITDKTTQLLVNGVLMIWNFIIALCAGFLCERVGRRPLFLISAVGMFLMWAVQTACLAVYSEKGILAAGHATMAFIFLYYAFYDIAFTPLIVSYTVEIMPYHLRAKGLTLFNFAVTLSLIFNQYVNPIALKHITWKYYIVYLVWLAVEAVYLYVYIIETKNCSLEETAALFDGEDALKNITAVTKDVQTDSIDEKHIVT